MSRSIQINDFVSIAAPGLSPTAYIIRSIDQSGIYVSTELDPNSTSLIIPNNIGGWKIYGTDLEYKLEFIANIPVQVPVQVPVPTSVSSKKIIMSGVIDANKAAANGDINKLELLFQRGILPTRQGANWAAGNGYINILEWMKKKEIFPTGTAHFDAAKNRHLNVMRWLA